MSKFELIKQLQEGPAEIEQPETSSITYQQYEIEIGKNTLIACVPLRECENFENALDNADELTQDALRDLLRGVRGYIKRT